MNNNHPFAKAVFYSIVLFAVGHLALSFFYGIFHGDTQIVNMFHVLSLDLIWPSLGSGLLNAVLAVVMIVAFWVVVGSLLLWRDKRADALRKEKPKK